MKKYSYLILSIALLFSACSIQEPRTVKVMTWNIWHGGLHGEKENNFEKDTINTRNIGLVLKEEDPDILLMQETYCCGMEIAREAGYEYSWRGSSNLSIHSKYPIVDTIHIFRPFNSHAVIIDVDGNDIMCVNIWLHYLPAYFAVVDSMPVDSLILAEGPTRLKEVNAIIHCLDSLEKLYQIPLIVGGDFNSGSHLDWIESTREWHYDKVIEWPVSKAMIMNGYNDSFRELNPDPVNALQGTWGFHRDDIISDRIDYIYYKGESLSTIHSKIVMDDPEGGFFNSDHRAILSEFEIR